MGARLLRHRRQFILAEGMTQPTHLGRLSATATGDLEALRASNSERLADLPQVAPLNPRGLEFAIREILRRYAPALTQSALRPTLPGEEPSRSRPRETGEGNPEDLLAGRAETPPAAHGKCERRPRPQSQSRAA